MQRDTINQIRDLHNEFFTNPDMTSEAVQAAFVEIIENAPQVSKTLRQRGRLNAI